MSAQAPVSLICIRRPCVWVYGADGAPVLLSAQAGSRCLTKSPFQKWILTCCILVLQRPPLSGQSDCDTALFPLAHTLAWTPGCLSPTVISTNGNSFAPLSVTVEVCAPLCFSLPRSGAKRRRRGSVRGFSHEVTGEGVCARDF